VVLRARIGAALNRRRAEIERAEMADSLQLLLDSTLEGIYGLDRHGACTFVNRAALAMLGRTRAELVGSHPHALIHHSRPDGSPYPAADCPILAVLGTGEPRRGREESWFRADGSSFPVEFSANPIRRGGEIDGVLVVFADISEQKRREEA
jgi:PAS domain S-box-containing protein